MATVKLQVTDDRLPSVGYLHTPVEDRALCDRPDKGLREEILEATNSVLRAYDLPPVMYDGR